MRKKIGFIVGIVVCTCVFGLGIYHSNASVSSPKMSKADIEEMITEQYPGEIASIEKRKELNNTVYEVELKDSAKGYKLKVDGDTGEILKIEEKMIATTDNSEKKKNSDKSGSVANSDTNDGKEKMDVNENKSDKTDKTPDESDDNEQSEQKKGNSKAKDKNKGKTASHDTSSDNKTVIDMKEAIQIGLKEYAGTITEIELDTENGKLIYEVEIVSGNQKAEIDIDAYTGEILLIGTESTDGIKGDPNSFISIEKAMQIALNEFSGTVIEVELEAEDDGYIYEVEIKSDNTEKEIEIDAYTGKIVDID